MAKFKSGSHLINTPTVGNDLSADGQALSILFGGVQVGVGSDSIKDTNLVATQVVTVEVPVEGITAKVGVIYDVRGSVDCEGSSKATLLMSTGGVTTPIDLSKLDGGSPNSYYNRVTGDFSGTVALVVTFCLIVERQSLQAQHQGLLTLGSLDVSFDNPTPAAKPQAS